MSMAPYGGLPGGMAVGSPYYTNAAGMTKLANRFSPDGVHVYVARGRPLLFSGDVAAVKRVRRVGRLCHRFFPSPQSAEVPLGAASSGRIHRRHRPRLNRRRHRTSSARGRDSRGRFLKRK